MIIIFPSPVPCPTHPAKLNPLATFRKLRYKMGWNNAGLHLGPDGQGQNRLYNCSIAHEVHVLSVQFFHSRYILNFLLWF